MQLLQSLPSWQEVKKGAQHPLVLVIDSHPSIGDMLSWMLRFQGYQPVCVANGQEALEWIANLRNTKLYPIAILLDLPMPVRGGAKKAIDTIRSHWHAPVPVPPIVLLAGEQCRYDDLACSAILTKPFHIHELQNTLNDAVHWRGHYSVS